MKTRNIIRYTRNSPGAALGANREIPLAHSKYKINDPGLNSVGTGMFHFTKWRIKIPLAPFMKGGLIILIYFASQKILADTHYVSTTGGNIPPYSTWADAAHNIQNAVDVSINGDVDITNNILVQVGCCATVIYSRFDANEESN